MLEHEAHLGGQLRDKLFHTNLEWEEETLPPLSMGARFEQFIKGKMRIPHIEPAIVVDSGDTHPIQKEKSHISQSRKPSVEDLERRKLRDERLEMWRSSTSDRGSRSASRENSPTREDIPSNEPTLQQLRENCQKEIVRKVLQEAQINADVQMLHDQVPGRPALQTWLQDAVKSFVEETFAKDPDIDEEEVVLDAIKKNKTDKRKTLNNRLLKFLMNAAFAKQTDQFDSEQTAPEGTHFLLQDKDTQEYVCVKVERGKYVRSPPGEVKYERLRAIYCWNRSKINTRRKPARRVERNLRLNRSVPHEKNTPNPWLHKRKKRKHGLLESSNNLIQVSQQWERGGERYIHTICLCKIVAM